jgi:hypothetical protein
VSSVSSPVKPDPTAQRIFNVCFGLVLGACTLTILLALLRFVWAPWVADSVRMFVR